MLFLNSSPQNFKWNRYHLFLQFVYTESNGALQIVVQGELKKHVVKILSKLIYSKMSKNIHIWTLNNPPKKFTDYQMADVEKILNAKLLYNNGRSWQTFMGLLMPKILEYFPNYPVSKLNGIRVKSA